MRSRQAWQPMIWLCVRVAAEDHCKSWVRATLPHACPSPQNATETIPSAGDSKVELPRHSWANEEHFLSEEIFFRKPGFARAFLTALAQARFQREVTFLGLLMDMVLHSAEHELRVLHVGSSECSATCESVL